MSHAYDFSAQVSRAVMNDRNRPCLYHVRGPCMHTKCLDAHYDTMAKMMSHGARKVFEHFSAQERNKMAQDIQGVRWFSGRACIGVVRVYDQYEGVKYYIGVGEGLDEEADIDFIAGWGSTFPNNVGDVLFDVDKSQEI